MDDAVFAELLLGVAVRDELIVRVPDFVADFDLVCVREDVAVPLAVAVSVAVIEPVAVSVAVSVADSEADGEAEPPPPAVDDGVASAATHAARAASRRARGTRREPGMAEARLRRSEANGPL